MVGRSNICGVGVNDADYPVVKKINNKTIVCPYYRRWSSMIVRCHSKSKKYKSYKDCYVCDSWLTFSIFKQWMSSQEWYGLDLDKDVIKPGNKVYSPETCAFIDSKLNKLLINTSSRRGKYRQGVHLCDVSKNFVASICVNGKRVTIGRFKNEDEAGNSYVDSKVRLIFSKIKDQKNKSVVAGLKLHAQLLIKTKVDVASEAIINASSKECKHE